MPKEEESGRNPILKGVRLNLLKVESVEVDRLPVDRLESPKTTKHTADQSISTRFSRSTVVQSIDCPVIRSTDRQFRLIFLVSALTFAVCRSSFVLFSLACLF
ncbi:hypothetical protein PHJA_002709900 [Phtheirospermum japonicum]|uniref:Uncharacterized protein n=1 Tax=Phtheirospermum japonicum TaxID=374723 RepID=A0A830CYV2_9LAMI|nr:hypothetical protein PHJA_002709900 [Phtheirospermum japonicum]